MLLAIQEKLQALIDQGMFMPTVMSNTTLEVPSPLSHKPYLALVSYTIGDE